MGLLRGGRAGPAGQATGRIITDAATEWLKKFSVVDTMLLIRQGNEQVQGFYGAMGFARDEVFAMFRRLPS